MTAFPATQLPGSTLQLCPAAFTCPGSCSYCQCCYPPSLLTGHPKFLPPQQYGQMKSLKSQKQWCFQEVVTLQREQKLMSTEFNNTSFIMSIVLVFYILTLVHICKGGCSEPAIIDY